MRRKLNESEVIEATLDDAKVQEALHDAVVAMEIYGEEYVTLDHLKSVIACRLENWRAYETDIEVAS